MKKMLAFAALAISSVAMADWGSATDNGAPRICIDNRTDARLQVFVDQRPYFIAAFRVTLFNSYQPQVLVSINARQLEPFVRPVWNQQYVMTLVYGCDSQNTVVISRSGMFLIVR